MNKKIFTLLMAFLVVSTSTVFALGAGSKETSLPTDKQGKNLYHLLVQFATAANNAAPSTTDSLLLMLDAKGQINMAKYSAVASTDLSNSLWCISVDAPSAAGQNPTFDFTNRKLALPLLVNDTDTAVNASTVGSSLDSIDVKTGQLGGWKFSAVYQNDLDTAKFLGTYISGTDSMLVFIKKNGKPGLRKFAANEVANRLVSDSVMLFTIMKPAELILKATDFNTVLSTGSEAFRTISHSMDVVGEGVTNPFKTAMKAMDVAEGSDYVYLYKNLDADKARYLRVDTSYQNSQGAAKFLAFAFDTLTTTAPGALVDQYKFKLVYNIFNDSLTISVGAARYKKEDGVSWLDSYVTDSAGTSGTIPSGDSLLIVMQDLIPNVARIITVGIQPVVTKMSLGFGCVSAATPGYTTVDEDLYVIKNTQGQYLAMPIYTDTITSPVWVNVEGNIIPERMPAYQWFVEKTRAFDPNETSPINILNREYADNDAQVLNLQLVTDASGQNVLSGYLKPDGFIKVSEALRTDSTLGYKSISPAVSQVTSYAFNYLHSYNDSKYLGLSSADSLLRAGDNKASFRILPKSEAPVAYGRTSKKVEDAVQLYRYSYLLKVSEGSYSGQVVTIDDQESYSVSKPGFIQQGDTALFYLKTNNTILDSTKDYYALVDTNTIYTGSTIKAGVDDDNTMLKVQNMRETRTSAFFVERNEEPLYRRFNTEKEGEANDMPDVVKFFRTNEPKDMLYEDAWSEYSKDKEINFLGVRNIDTYPTTDNFSYAIYVDTAFVARPAVDGAIEDTPKPQYLLGVGVTVQADGKYCPEHGWNTGCPHEQAYKGYVRARYLTNATDSAAINEDYIWDTSWDRLAFVDAVHRGDSLFIIKPEFNDNANLDMLKLSDYSRKVIYLGNNLHKDVVFSFRLTGEDDNFLIESENESRANVAAGTQIAPMTGGWVKIQNGVPVISRGSSIVAMTEAERFNVAKTDEAPVANEEISTTDVEVIAVNGAVIIKNAAGKKVTVSNILGKTLASTAITSDEATITIPAGIAVVAVEGEDAVKVVVR